MVDNEGVTGTPPTPSALENAVASSPETIQQAQETQTPTAEVEGVIQEPEEEAKIPKSRLDEVIAQRNEARERELWYRQQLEQRQQVPQQPSQVPEELGNTPEEREFYRNQRKMMREEALKVAQEQRQQVTPFLEATIRELSTIKVEQFRKEHPEIKRNSDDERAIASRIADASSRGFTLTPEDAYWMVMGPRGVKSADERVKQQLKQKIEIKKQANVETSNISANAPVPKGKVGLRQRIQSEADKMDWS